MAATSGFLAGAITVAFVMWNLPNLTHPANSSGQPGVERLTAASGEDVRPARAEGREDAGSLVVRAPRSVPW